MPTHCILWEWDGLGEMLEDFSEWGGKKWAQQCPDCPRWCPALLCCISLATSSLEPAGSTNGCQWGRAGTGLISAWQCMGTAGFCCRSIS